MSGGSSLNVDMTEVDRFEVEEVKNTEAKDEVEKYANNLAQAIESIKIDVNATTGIYLLKKLASYYYPALFKEPAHPVPYQTTPSIRKKNNLIRADEFIILAYQIWLTTSDESLTATQNQRADTTQVEPVAIEPFLVGPPVSSTSETYGNSNRAPTGVVSKPSQGFFQGFVAFTDEVTQKTTRAINSLSSAPYYAHLRAQKHPVTISKVEESATSSLSIKQELRELFDKVGLPRAGNYNGNFARMYNEAFAKFNQKAINLEKRDVFSNSYKETQFTSSIIEGFNRVFSNILSCVLIDAGGSIELGDNKKVMLITTLLGILKRIRLNRSHDSEREALITQAQHLVTTVNEAFRKREKEKLQKLFDDVNTEINNLEITHGVPINVMIETFNGMLKIASEFLKETPQKIVSELDEHVQNILIPYQSVSVPLLLKNKQAIIANKDLELEEICKNINIQNLHDQYTLVCFSEREALINELAKIKSILLQIKEKILPRFTPKIARLKEQIFNDNNEVNNLMPWLTTQDELIRTNTKNIKQLTDEKNNLVAQNNAASQLREEKIGRIRFYAKTWQENIRSNYNKKYTYTQFTEDLLKENDHDKRLPVDKLASRWWDGIWFLGIERFCNWCTGTTREERQNDAIAAVKMHESIGEHKKLDDKLNISDEKIEWLLKDINQADTNAQTGKQHQTDYNKKVDEYNEAKSAEETNNPVRQQKIDKKQKKIAQFEKSNTELAPKKSDNGKKLDELNVRIYANKQEVISIKASLEKEITAIGENITTKLSNDKQTNEVDFLQSLQTAIINTFNEIEKSLQVIAIATTNNQASLPLATTSSEPAAVDSAVAYKPVY